jgi:serine/threonine protein kinase
MRTLRYFGTLTGPARRPHGVGAGFLAELDDVEDELTAPEPAEEADPLTAGKGTVVGSWIVERVLGKGSTAGALLAAKAGERQVLKVALSASAAQRLAWEAATLRKLTDSRIVRLIDGPFEVAGRTVIALDGAGERTLADEIREQGLLSIGELEKLGEDLLHAVLYLEEEKVWHRDIKPDNLALREVPRKGRRLVLFDFSLAGVPDSETGVGTSVYLDPFLGTGHRQGYDQAAERYAVAVTLHEMASGELPSWGDGLVEAAMLDPSEQLPHLAEDSFDPVLRDRLVEFFGRALHRDAARRFGSLKEMTRAWTDVFRGLDETPPLTTRHTITLDDSAEPDEARDAAAKAATADTPLAAAGLTARALSIAQQQPSPLALRRTFPVRRPRDAHTVKPGFDDPHSPALRRFFHYIRDRACPGWASPRFRRDPPTQCQRHRPLWRVAQDRRRELHWPVHFQDERVGHLLQQPPRHRDVTVRLVRDRCLSLAPGIDDASRNLVGKDRRAGSVSPPTTCQRTSAPGRPHARTARSTCPGPRRRTRRPPRQARRRSSPRAARRAAAWRASPRRRRRRTASGQSGPRA